MTAVPVAVGGNPETLSRRHVLGAYVALTKPRIIELLLVTTVPAMVLAARGVPDLWTLAITLVGGTLAAGSANAINCVVDRDIDEVMVRTRRRPRARHQIPPVAALRFGLVLGAAATLLLGFGTNWLSAALGVAAIAVSGEDFLSAYFAGLEVACRLTKAIALPPAEADIGWSIGGIVCGLSSALAAGSLLRLDRDQLTWALGIAASEAAGTRAEHGTMTAALIFGQAAQTGVRSAILAADGFTSSPRSLEGNHGYARMFSKRANVETLVENMNERYEMPFTTYKPFPTDIAIHPGIDAMCRLRAEHRFGSREIARVQVSASGLAATFCDRPNPADELEAKFSLQHWVAAAAAYGKAQLEQGKIEVVQDPEIKRLRAAIEVTADADLAWDAIRMSVELTDGRHLETHIAHCVGSAQSPMSDSEIDAKFIAQASLAIGHNRAAPLVKMCWDVENLADVSVLARSAC
jgi:2-methylcitrate dehydratase PrpD